MRFEWNPAKDAANRVKHGFPLSLGVNVPANAMNETVEWVEGEERHRAFGLLGVVLFVCIHTMRGSTYRIISVRKATRQEQRECQL